MYSSFWAKVDVAGVDECWLWTGGKTNGYGMVTIKRKTMSAHRVSYKIKNGEIPTGKTIMHKCDNKACVNPAHLFAGTQHDNVQDMLSKDRGARGERTRNAKLSDVKVLMIRKDMRSAREIADEYGVLPGTIHCVKNRKSWTHI